MLTFTVRNGRLSARATWDDGQLSGDERLVQTVEAMTEAGVEVDVTPVGPSLLVSTQEPRTLWRAFEDMGSVTVEGEWPEPTWDDGEHEDDAVF